MITRNLLSIILFLLTAVDTGHLDGAYGLRFGMAQEEVIQTLMDRYRLKPSEKLSRNDHVVLEFGRLPRREVSRLRVFVHPEKGVFWIEEEILLRWDLQRGDQDNLEYHERRLERVLNRLRQEYGVETILEETHLGGPYSTNNFATATWSFADSRWIHVIYEPQDWELYPEMFKIVVIYRDSNLDPREP